MKLAVGAVSALLFLPALAAAHSAGPLDPHGCHDDRRKGEYHCHIGTYRGLTFRSKGGFTQEVRAGKTVEQMRAERGLDPGTGEEHTSQDEDDGWLSWVPFLGKSRSGSRDVGTGEVIVPRGIEERLRVLQDLHDKGLISDDEYAAKRKDILGEL